MISNLRDYSRHFEKNRFVAIEKPWTDETGIEYIGIIPFLLDEAFLRA